MEMSHVFSSLNAWGLGLGNSWRFSRDWVKEVQLIPFLINFIVKILKITFKFVLFLQKHIHSHSHMMEKFEVHIFSSFEAMRVIPMTSHCLASWFDLETMKKVEFIHVLSNRKDELQKYIWCNKDCLPGICQSTNTRHIAVLQIISWQEVIITELQVMVMA